MQVVEFLFPKELASNPHWVLCWLPKPVLAILSRVFLQYIHVDLGQMDRSMLYQQASGELAHTVESIFQPIRVELCIKEDCVEMSWHYDVSIHPKMFVLNAIIQAVRYDLAVSLMKTGSHSTTVKVT